MHSEKLSVQKLKIIYLFDYRATKQSKLSQTNASKTFQSRLFIFALINRLYKFRFSLLYLKKTPDMCNIKANNKRLIHLIFTGLILLSMVSCNKSTRSFFQEGVSIELAKYRYKHIYDLQYDLLFQIPESKDEKITGEVTIHFKPLKARHGVVLDFTPGEGNIHKVMVNNSDVDYFAANGHIYIDANFLVPRQNNTIHISFTSSDQAMNRSEDFMYTLFVPGRASTAFPCFDQPDLKAAFNLTLQTPENWECMSNGEKTSKITSDGKNTVAFSQTNPISTYLFAFTAGRFSEAKKEQNGKTITLLHREPESENREAVLEKIFSYHFNALDWMEEYTGIKYPYNKFGLAILPGFQYSGMEHPGAIWYRDTRFFLGDNPTLSEKTRRVNLIAHETAHMWFGNLVTMKWFDDVWLKEVFAGFMADKITAREFPEVNFDLKFLLTHFPEAYSINRTKGSHPIKQELQNLDMAGTLYGPIIYHKSPIVFRQLENLMGENNFKIAVRSYLQTFSHTNADWDQLVDILDAHTPEDMKEWSNYWVYGTKMPSFGYELIVSDEGKREIRITSMNADENTETGQQLLKGVLISSGKSSYIEARIKGDVTNLETESDDKEMIILPNGAGWGYGYFQLRKQEVDFITSNYQEIENPVVRASIAINFYENFLSDNIGYVEFENFLTTAIQNENDPLIINYLLEISGEFIYNFVGYGSGFSKDFSDKLWQLLQDETQPSKSAVFDLWIRINNSEKGTQRMVNIAQGKISFNGYSGYSPSTKQKTQLLAELVMRDKNTEHMLEEHITEELSDDEKLRISFLLPSLSDKKQQRDAFFRQLEEPGNRNPEPYVLDALYFLHHPLHENQGFDYIPASLDMLTEIQKTGDIFFPQRWLAATLNNYNQSEVHEMVKTYLKNNPDLPDNLRLKVLQAADNLNRRKE